MKGHGVGGVVSCVLSSSVRRAVAVTFAERTRGLNRNAVRRAGRHTLDAVRTQARQKVHASADGGVTGGAAVTAAVHATHGGGTQRGAGPLKVLCNRVRHSIRPANTTGTSGYSIGLLAIHG